VRVESAEKSTENGEKGTEESVENGEKKVRGKVRKTAPSSKL